MNFRSTTINATLHSALAGLMTLIAASAFAQVTDIANAPLTNGGAVPIKPNIMLLMDTSSSMSWAHIPDQLESDVKLPIGYRAAQCNMMYYNPRYNYQLPKRPDGTSFPVPSFTSAPRDGFNPNSDRVNLDSEFQASTGATRSKNRSPQFDDARGPAYYYWHSSGQTFAPTLAPCSDEDKWAQETDPNQLPKVPFAATISPDGVTGDWARIQVSDKSGPGLTDERQNFAIWYSYYRTRMNLAKTAITLAFAPLNDSLRVGFITMKPMRSDTSSGPVEAEYYVPIKDFNAVNRVDWFNKVLSQKPAGSSPAREALARVGRHYAGQTDGINEGMPEDPVQYSCQQNFAIMTTDGTWNVRAETAGPVKIDGQTRVGQQDGVLTGTTGNSPRPIWDGQIDSSRQTTDKKNDYLYATCGDIGYLTYSTRVRERTAQLLQQTSQTLKSTDQTLQSSTQVEMSTVQVPRSTLQTTRTTSQLNRTTTQNLQSTRQNLQSTQQTTRSTSQLLRSTIQNRMTSSQVLRQNSQQGRITIQRFQQVERAVQSTTQNLSSTTQMLQSTTQTLRSTTQALQTTTQDRLTRVQNTQSTSQTTQSTSQTLQRTFQNRATSTQVVQSTSQALESTFQVLQVTTQNLRVTSQVQATEKRVYMRTSRVEAYNLLTELASPVKTCVVGGDIGRCDIYETGPTLVLSCSTKSPSAANDWTTTQCDTKVSGPTFVASCTPQTANATNGLVTISCSSVVSSPTPVQTCTASGPTAGNNWTTTTCSTNTTGPTPVSSCTAVIATAANNWVATTCPPNNKGPTPVASCTSASPTSGNNWTTTSCSSNNSVPTGVQTCTPSSPTSGNNWTATNCSNPPATNYTNQPVQTCTAQTGGSGNGWQTITCSPNNTGPTPVQTCTPQTAALGNNWTTITCTPNNTGPIGVASCTMVAATAGNNWTTTSCGSTNSPPIGVQTCSGSAATAGNNWTTTSCGNNNVTNQPVQSCTPQTGNSGNGWETITCSPLVNGPTPVQTCTPVAESSSNNWTATTCSTNNTAPTPVQTCTPVTAAAGNAWTATICTPNNTTNVPVQTCTTSAASIANNWTATSCTPNNTSSVPVQTCTNSSATSANNWTATTCSTNNATNVAVASCTPQGANSGNNWVSIVCGKLLVQPPTPSGCTLGTVVGPAPNFDQTVCYEQSATVPTGTCTPQTGNAGNAWTTILCDAISVTPAAPVQSCTPVSASAGNNWIATICSYPALTNFQDRPVETCTRQTATFANQWITIDCPTPVTTAPVAVQTCTPVNASAGNNWTATICTTNSTSPVAVDPATCTLGTNRATRTTAGTAPNWTNVICAANDTTNVPVETCAAASPSAGNSWTTVTCPTPVVTTNVPVAACTPAPATGANNWTTTTCPTPIKTGPTAVDTCTPTAASSANNFVETACTTTVTGPIGVQSCTTSNATAANKWVATTCGSNNNLNQLVASCTASPATASNSWTQTTCPAPTRTGPTPVSSCTPQAASSTNNWTETTCTFPVASNYANRPVASCVPQEPSAGNNWIQITCVQNGASNVPTASCSPAAANSGNGYTATSCNTVVTGPTPVASGNCSASSPNSSNQFITTKCTLSNTGPTPVASCTPAEASAANNFIQTTCESISTPPSRTKSCTEEVASAANNYTSTTCDKLTGQKIQYLTTTTVTTQPFSGGLPAGVPSVSSTQGPPKDIDNACYIAGMDTLPPLPNPGKPGTTWTNGFDKKITLQPVPPAPCQAWPCESVSNDQSGGLADTLADVAQYYYVTDLRPDMPDNVRSNGSGPEDDRATWQHMTTFTIGLGVSGVLNFREDYRSLSTKVGDFADIREGKKGWPIPKSDQLTTIDDFWHAAVNGRGLYFSATTPSNVIRGLSGALTGTRRFTGAGAAAAPSSQRPADGDNLTYIATYQGPQWIGELEARLINLTTGAPMPDVIWSASSKLGAKVGDACDNRRIWLFRQGAANNMTPFTWGTRACDNGGAPAGASLTGLDANEQAFFDASRVSLLSHYVDMTKGLQDTVDQRTPAAGANLVNFIRGQRGNEGFESNRAGRLYRSREAVLGDIVNSQPAYVRRATANYLDEKYADFVAQSASRIPMVYVGSNGGMLHAFRAGTAPNDPNGGEEEWAFIPTQVLPNLYKLADANYAANHTYLVDGSPAAFDAYDRANAAWKKVLVGGLRAGGRGYYALDVTDPLSPKALWEFNWSSTCYDGKAATSRADCHLGFTFGTPTYTKLKDGTWVVLVSSGYNNVNAPAKAGDGQGYLYVLDAFTGRIIYKISTGYGSAAAPSGLGPLAVYTDDPTVDATAIMVYGADLAGNVWRFDINNPDLDKRRASLVAVAKAPDGTRQPVTAALNLLERDGIPYIQLGTGRLLGTTDIADNQVQSIYVFPDKTTEPISDLRSVLAPQVQTDTNADPNEPSGKRSISCKDSALCGGTSGWYSDLPRKGERVTVDPKIQLGTLGVATSIPTAEQCSVLGTGATILVDALTGNAIPGTNGLISQGFLPSLPVGMTILQLPGGGVAAVIADATGGQNALPFPVQQRGPVGKRVTWREVVQ